MSSQDRPIPEDERVQRGTWALQRIAWALFAGLIAVGLAGLFGQGVLSNKIAQNPWLSMSYERFQRITNQTEYVFRIPAYAPAELHFNAAFQKAYLFNSVLPPPAHSTPDANGFTLSFARSQQGPVLVTMVVRPMHIGSFDFSVETAGRPLPFNVFIYP